MATNPTLEALDTAMMDAALALAERGLGRVWPNPSVGCVLVRDGVVVGRGWTQPGGRPHAEQQALDMAGSSARDATAYVTLEPCAHEGKSPPCAEKLISAGVARVVAALKDPDPRVDGAGLEMLRSAGMDVDLGLREDAARALNIGFLTRVEAGRPMLTLKVATTLDGRIATHTGESKWITGERARRAGHLLRARHDAILVGVGTAMSDDPELTCRLPGLEERSPVRVVADSRLRLPLTSRLVQTAKQYPTWLVTSATVDRDREQAFSDAGVEIIEVGTGPAGLPDMADTLNRLAERGITRLLVEGGSHVSASLLRDGLIDRIAWFRAGKIMGGDGVPVVQSLSRDKLADVPGFRLSGLATVGEDILETYVVRR